MGVPVRRRSRCHGAENIPPAGPGRQWHQVRNRVQSPILQAMCRFYTFRSTHPRKVECEIIGAQNSLLRQSSGDADGRVHSDGWGLGHYTVAGPRRVRRATAADADDAFRWAAAEAFSTNVIAHVRSATVGGLGEINAHPFQVGDWLFAHNGTIAALPRIRERMLAAMTADIRQLPRGSTDSEHLFHLILSAIARNPDAGPTAAVRETVREVERWAREASPDAEFAVNLVLTRGPSSTVLRYGRSLWYVQRDAVHACQVCGGKLHVMANPPERYRATVFASEPITTDERWTPVANGQLFTISPNLELVEEAL